QRSYAHFASQEESRLQEIYIRRGRALKTKVYPNAHQRRRLYRTGLPPRAGSKLLELYPAFKLKLENGRDYGIWDPKDRFDYIADLVDQLTSLPKYKRGEKADRQKVDWREVLQWWLNPASFTKKTQVNVSTWYKYVSDNFAFRFNWGLGSVVALAADEALLEMFLEPSIENWPIIGLPWIVLWLKELIVWGTLEPVAAYLLSKNLEETRLLAEEAAKSYYAEQSQELTPDELLNPSTIRDWATKRYRPEAYSFDTNPLSQMSVSLSQDFSKVEARIWKVIPVEVDNTLYWYDPAGILLATSERPLTWSDSFLQNYDFTLNIDQKAVSTESYLAFR
ncbi:MAG TPA: DEAD/DEAH box helicase, partial [Methylomirabilota bacterium]|nr:DEAD/DEAH box helicase [Methylomirabilota bacterium]